MKMKYKLIFIALLVSAKLFAQSISPQSIQDSVIGWMKVYNFKGIKESKKVDDKLYSPAQLSLPSNQCYTLLKLHHR